MASSRRSSTRPTAAWMSLKAQVEADLGVHVLVDPAVVAQSPQRAVTSSSSVTSRPPSPITVRFLDG